MDDDPLGGRASERVMLGGFLDWYRAVAARKVGGLTEEQAARVATPSGLSPLGIVRHLAWAERQWFRWYLAGEDVALYLGPDNAVTFRLEPADTITSVVATYEAENDAARRIVGDIGSLDQVSARTHPIVGPVTARWVLVHLIEETARHAGHLDVIRERLDGATGD